MTSIATNRSTLQKQLRKQLRQRRRQLTKAQQHAAAANLCRQLTRQPLFARSRHIALYLANDGEIDPAFIVNAAWKLGKRCYLPVLQPGQDNRLWFIRYQPNTPLIKNRFGILEPRAQYRRAFSAKYLDLVLMPLVGFDDNGARIGMGGGFYDRTFAFKAESTIRPPYLLGLAHECQRVEQLELASWDIPLNAIATDRRLIMNPHSDAKRSFIHT